MRAYRYVGSEEIARHAHAAIERLQPASPADVRAWAARARGGQVLGAGEVWFDVGPQRVTVATISNQSTGYCPEPDCWPAVRDALAPAAWNLED